MLHMLVKQVLTRACPYCYTSVCSC